MRALHGPESPRSAQFCVSTRDCPDKEWHWAFGRVEEGLEILMAVASHRHMKEVFIVDCGVVLPV